MLEAVSAVIWGPWTACVFMLAGIFFSAQNGFFQLRHVRLWMRSTAGSLFKKRENGGISPVQSSLAALAGTLGTGNIVGVAAALAAGGPGAIFWMWCAAFFGMMISYSENVLGILYRQKTSAGGFLGGPMMYIEKGLGSPSAARLYAALCLLSAFAMGNMAQTGAIADSISHSFDIHSSVIGAAVAFLAAPAVLRGTKGIIRFTDRLVPVMAGAYIFICSAVIIINIKSLPSALASVFRGAFSLRAAGGGFGAAFLVGIRRGVFTNEAGLGTTVMIHSCAETCTPTSQGMWGIFEVFADTMIVCTLTALALLTTGRGIESAFSCVLGVFSDKFVALSLALFAFATVIAWSCYGEQVAVYLFGEKSRFPFRVLYLAAPLPGALLGASGGIALSDILNGMMCILNLACVLLLSRQVSKETKRFVSRRRER